MKKYIYTIWMLAVVMIAGVSFIGCSDDDDFPNKPQAIDIEKDIVLTPVYGGVNVEWTPNPADENFVFLHIELKNHNGVTCNYNVSRYNSSLVNEEQKNEAASVTIKNLLEQEYTLHFSAFNNENQSIDLGSRKVTPLDYRLAEPDSIFDVTVSAGLDYKVKLKWREVPFNASIATKGVRFSFVNVDNPALSFSKDFDLGVRRAEFPLEEKYKGEYRMTYGTFTEGGKEFKKTLEGDDQTVLVGLPEPIEYWTKAARKDWTITGCSENLPEDYEDGRFINMFDGNENSYWHSKWWPEQDTEESHHFIVDIKNTLKISKCLFQQRKDNPDRQVGSVKIYISETDGDWGESVYDGPLALGTGDKCVKQSIKVTPTIGRYIKVVTSDGTGGSLQCMAEFGIVARTTE